MVVQTPVQRPPILVTSVEDGASPLLSRAAACREFQEIDSNASLDGQEQAAQYAALAGRIEEASLSIQVQYVAASLEQGDDEPWTAGVLTYC